MLERHFFFTCCPYTFTFILHRSKSNSSSTYRLERAYWTKRRQRGGRELKVGVVTFLDVSYLYYCLMQKKQNILSLSSLDAHCAQCEQNGGPDWAPHSSLLPINENQQSSSLPLNLCPSCPSISSLFSANFYLFFCLRNNRWTRGILFYPETGNWERALANVYRAC